jgi:hypothetical protein
LNFQLKFHMNFSFHTGNTCPACLTLLDLTTVILISTLEKLNVKI